MSLDVTFDIYQDQIFDRLPTTKIYGWRSTKLGPNVMARVAAKMLHCRQSTLHKMLIVERRSEQSQKRTSTIFGKVKK